jgi:hypothetical protein
MKAMTIASPILPGKTEAWKKFGEEFSSGKQSGFAELLKKGGVTRVRAWLSHTPDGDVALIVHEGPDPERWLPTAMEANGPAAEWFREQLKELHGLTPDRPMPPLPELAFDYQVD